MEDGSILSIKAVSAGYWHGHLREVRLEMRTLVALPHIGGFAPQMTGPEVLSIGGSWKTSSTDPQGFSVLHETTFDLPAGFAKDRRVTINLGDVAVMAKVTINDITHDTLCRKPYLLEITSDLKPGTNRIRGLVTSTSEGKPSFGPTTLHAFQRMVVD
jgi:hypothetical protein